MAFTGWSKSSSSATLAIRRLKLLDVNPRVWGWHTLGRRPESISPTCSCDRLSGSSSRTVRNAGVRWVRGLTDFPTVSKEIRARRHQFVDVSQFDSARPGMGNSGG